MTILRTTQTETLCITEEVAAEMIAGWLRVGASMHCVNEVYASYVGGCSGQLKLATALEFFQYRFSDSFGGNPPL